MLLCKIISGKLEIGRKYYYEKKDLNFQYFKRQI